MHKLREWKYRIRPSSDKVTTILTPLIDVMDTAGKVVPAELGGGVLSAMSTILKAIRDTVQSKEDFLDIIRQCDSIKQLIEDGNRRMTSGSRLSEDAAKALKTLEVAVNDIGELVVARDSRKFSRRLLTNSIDKDKIKEMSTRLGQSLIFFSATLNLAMSLAKAEEAPASTPLKAGAPPPRPEIFHGRDDLVAEVVDMLLSSGRRHVALLGTGGIGKSSLAKAILNESKIRERFGDRCVFVRFDDMASSQITLPTFINRVSRALGIPSAADHGLILEDVRNSNTLLVLDNTETFLDSKASPDVPHIKNAISEISGYAPLSLLLTSRSRELPNGLRYNHIDVPNLDARSAYETFVETYQESMSQSDPTLERILAEVGFHPLTINLLANATRSNSWSIEDLNQQWAARHSQVISTGQGKDESLADSIRLSLNSPSLAAYGDNTQRVMQIIAFFPQGIPRKKLATVFPSITSMDEIVNTLHRHCLLVFSGDFVTMLMPIRIFINDAFPRLDAPVLRDVRNHYYEGLDYSNNAKSLVVSEDTNIEFLITTDIKTASDEASLVAALDACALFIYHLCDYKPRPTSLKATITAVGSSVNLAIGTPHPNHFSHEVSQRSAIDTAQLSCLKGLGTLANWRSNHLESVEIYLIALDLAQKMGHDEEALILSQYSALNYQLLGNYAALQKMLDSIQAKEKTPSGITRMLKGRLMQVVDADITGESLALAFHEAQGLLEHNSDILNARFYHAESAFARALIDNDIQASRTALEDAIACDPALFDDYYFRRHLATVAFMDGDIINARDHLQVARGHIVREGNMKRASIILLDLSVLAITENKAGEARDLLQQVKEDIKAHDVVSDSIHWTMVYISGTIALASDHLSEAYRIFEETKNYCEAHQEYHMRALSMRAMGEVAYLQSNFDKAQGHFEETARICHDAGILPKFMYRTFETTFFARTIPATYGGWPLFLQECNLL